MTAPHHPVVLEAGMLLLVATSFTSYLPPVLATISALLCCIHYTLEIFDWVQEWKSRRRKADNQGRGPQQ